MLHLKNNVKYKPVFLNIAIIFFLFISHIVKAQEKTDSKTSAFFEIIRSGDIAKLKESIKNGAAVNSSLDDFSPLMAATLSGSLAEMELLINNGAYINYKNKDSLSALWMAVPDFKKTKLLLDHGAVVQNFSKENYTVLVKLALFPGSTALFKLLVQHGGDLKRSCKDNLLLYNAASTCDTILLSYLIRQGLNVNDTIAVGDYPINSAMNYRCFYVLKMLVENGAKVNVSPLKFPLDLFNGMTPLMFAALSSDKESFYYLLAHGADVNAKSKRGQSVLIYLQQSDQDNADMTATLIKYGADPLQKDPEGKDALYYAKRKGNTKSYELLEKYVNK